jgi:hypothetical protein
MLAVGRHWSDHCPTPVRPMFEKLVVGLAAPVRPVPLTGQTGQARDTPKPFLSFQHFTKEMKWLRLC